MKKELSGLKTVLILPLVAMWFILGLFKSIGQDLLLGHEIKLVDRNKHFKTCKKYQSLWHMYYFMKLLFHV